MEVPGIVPGAPVVEDGSWLFLGGEQQCGQFSGFHTIKFEWPVSFRMFALRLRLPLHYLHCLVQLVRSHLPGSQVSLKTEANERLAQIQGMASENLNVNILLQLSRSWCKCLQKDTMPLGPLIGYALQQRMPLQLVTSEQGTSDSVVPSLESRVAGSGAYIAGSAGLQAGGAYVAGSAGLKVDSAALYQEVGTVAHHVIRKLVLALHEAGFRPLQQLL